MKPHLSTMIQLHGGFVLIDAARVLAESYTPSEYFPPTVVDCKMLQLEYNRLNPPHFECNFGQLVWPYRGLCFILHPEKAWSPSWYSPLSNLENMLQFCFPHRGHLVK